ncbi:multidrug effflux MFS transporter [Tistrella bauzanensis]|jgi:DHA1 family bicyclomycin/chloramphenicol resistance-like MFS transporter|uniref:Bcr/CflA family efflux transporter n=1 Tax=Tistrella arctica TaxID=3133430 RepID=A0ABU9YG77_9PROT
MAEPQPPTSHPSATGRPPASGPSGIIILFLIALTALGPLSTDLYLPSLPAMGRDLGTDAATAQLTLTGYMWGLALAQLVYGPVSDALGRRPVLITGMTVQVAASILCLYSVTIDDLVLARVLQGTGACAGAVIGRALVRDLFPPERAGSIFATITSATALAPMVAPMIGGQIEVLFGWRANFAVLAGIGLLLIAGAVLILPEPITDRDIRRIRPVAILRSMGGLIRDRRFLGLAICTCSAFGGLFAWVSNSSVLLIEGYRVAPDRFGLFFGLAVAGYVLGAATGGRLVMRLGSLNLLGLGIAIMALGGLAMAAQTLAGIDGPLGVALSAAALLAGAGLALPQAFTAAILPYPRIAGTASALIGCAQMTTGGIVAAATAPLADGTPTPIAATILVLSAVALVAYVRLVRPTPAPPITNG